MILQVLAVVGLVLFVALLGFQIFLALTIVFNEKFLDRFVGKFGKQLGLE